MKVNYSSWVFAENRGKDGIWLYSGLKSNPKLRKVVLEHELVHTGHVSLKDFLHDFSLKDIKYAPQFFRFFFRNPRAFVLYLLPFSFRFKPFRVYIDYTRVLAFIVGYFLVMWMLLP